jgi:hypothetical protein
LRQLTASYLEKLPTEPKHESMRISLLLTAGLIHGTHHLLKTLNWCDENDKFGNISCLTGRHPVQIQFKFLFRQLLMLDGFNPFQLLGQ